MKQTKCWSCGSGLFKNTEEKNTYECLYCGSRNNIEDISEMADKVIDALNVSESALRQRIIALGDEVRESVEAQDARKIYNIRQIIEKEISSRNPNSNTILIQCRKLQSYLQEDYLAGLYISYYTKSQGWSLYLEYLKKDVSRIDRNILLKTAEFAIANVDVAFEYELYEYTSKIAASIGVKSSHFNGAIEKRLAEIQDDLDRFTEIPRDVFICFKRQNQEYATAIHEMLDEEGITNFFSPYNLPQLTNESYWNRLHYAIENCKVFLVVSSKILESSQSQNNELNDALREIEYCARINKKIKRLEIKVDDPMQYRRTVRLKRFMEDHGSYILGYGNKFNCACEELAEAIVDILFESPKEVKISQKAQQNTVEKKLPHKKKQKNPK